MFPLPAISSTPPVQDLLPRIATAPAETPAPALTGPVSGAAGANPESFGKLFAHMVQEVNDRQIAASDAMQSLQSGGSTSLHQAVIAMEEANVSFQLMVEVRNRLLDSYQEIMRMQV